MDFRVKKLILEEGMKNIAETEGVGLQYDDNPMTEMINVCFVYNNIINHKSGSVTKKCDYMSVKRPDTDVFKTIEDVRFEVQQMKKKTGNRICEVKYDQKTFEAIRKDFEVQRYFYADLMGVSDVVFSRTSIPKIKNVIFNYPATIVFWADGDKTVVKCQGDDIFDPEKGLAMAIVKKMNGGKGNYCEIFKPWIEKYEKENTEANDYTLKETIEHIVCQVNDLKKRLNIKSPSCIAGHKDVVEDIQDILDGKVDPLMIKVDEEEDKPVKDVIATFRSKASTFKTCVTCKHEDLDLGDEPCKECLTKCAPNNVTPKWEPKE